MVEVAAQAATKVLSFAVPAHIAARIKAAGGGNIPDGKVWTMNINGERKRG
jgi:hypothetical protein